MAQIDSEMEIGTTIMEQIQTGGKNNCLFIGFQRQMHLCNKEDTSICLCIIRFVCTIADLKVVV